MSGRHPEDRSLCPQCGNALQFKSHGTWYEFQCKDECTFRLEFDPFTENGDRAKWVIVESWEKLNFFALMRLMQKIERGFGAGNKDKAEGHVDRIPEEVSTGSITYQEYAPEPKPFPIGDEV